MGTGKCTDCEISFHNISHCNHSIFFYYWDTCNNIFGSCAHQQSLSKCLHAYHLSFTWLLFFRIFCKVSHFSYSRNTFSSSSSFSTLSPSQKIRKIFFPSCQPKLPTTWIKPAASIIRRIWAERKIIKKMKEKMPAPRRRTFWSHHRRFWD